MVKIDLSKKSWEVSIDDRQDWKFMSEPAKAVLKEIAADPLRKAPLYLSYEADRSNFSYGDYLIPTVCKGLLSGDVQITGDLITIL